MYPKMTAKVEETTEMNPCEVSAFPSASETMADGPMSVVEMTTAATPPPNCISLVSGVLMMR